MAACQHRPAGRLARPARASTRCTSTMRNPIGNAVVADLNRQGAQGHPRIVDPLGCARGRHLIALSHGLTPHAHHCPYPPIALLQRIADTVRQAGLRVPPADTEFERVSGRWRRSPHPQALAHYTVAMFVSQHAAAFAHQHMTRLSFNLSADRFAAVGQGTVDASRCQLWPAHRLSSSLHLRTIQDSEGLWRAIAHPELFRSQNLLLIRVEQSRSVAATLLQHRPLAQRYFRPCYRCTPRHWMTSWLAFTMPAHKNHAGHHQHPGPPARCRYPLAAPHRAATAWSPFPAHCQLLTSGFGGVHTCAYRAN